ncbi:hypothetical protein Tco_0562888, partial [Tanacetum coccineum]
SEKRKGLVASQPCLLRFSFLGRLGCRVLRMMLNVEVNLRGLLGLGKSNLNGEKNECILVPPELSPSSPS